MKALFATLVVCAAAACGSGGKDYNGIGQWVLLETELSEAEGACTPGDITFCSHADSVNLGGQSATVNLYFKGSAPTAKLVEIELSARSCEPTRVANALAGFLGAPDARRDKRLFWQGKRAFVSGKLPGRTGRCTVNFVTPKDEARIAELRAE